MNVHPPVSPFKDGVDTRHALRFCWPMRRRCLARSARGSVWDGAGSSRPPDLPVLVLSAADAVASPSLLQRSGGRCVRDRLRAAAVA